MKIDQPNVPGAGTASSAGATKSIAASAYGGLGRSGSLSGGGDQAELSGISQAIQSYQSDRSARIGKLTALVRSGKYDVSPALISGAIVGEALSAGSSVAR
jgi:hypothetical protein